MTAFFADNTVLVNFGLLGRLQLLESLLNGHGTWTDAVASECARSSMLPELTDLASVPGFLGAPHRPETAQEWTDLRTFQIRLSSPGDGPLKHLGEAETLAIMSNRTPQGAFMTDDGGADTLATALSIRVVTTADLIRLAVKLERLSRDEAWADVQYLRSLPRHVPRAPWSRTAFMDWLQR